MALPKPTKKNIDLIYDNTPADYKSIRNGKKCIMYFDKGTVSGPIETMPNHIFQEYLNNATEKQFKKKTIQNFRETAAKVLNPLGITFTVYDYWPVIQLEPNTRKVPANLKPGSFDGMQLNYHFNEKWYEVVEYQAGPKENELWQYKESKTLKPALLTLAKGRFNLKPIKKW